MNEYNEKQKAILSDTKKLSRLLDARNILYTRYSKKRELSPCNVPHLLNDFFDNTGIDSRCDICKKLDIEYDTKMEIINRLIDANLAK